MIETKVYNVCFIVNNPTIPARVSRDGDGPFYGWEAIRIANKMRKDWRVWVEHITTGERLYENATEKAFSEANA